MKKKCSTYVLELVGFQTVVILPRKAACKIESNKILEMFFRGIFLSHDFFSLLFICGLALQVYSKLFSNLRENKFEFKKEIEVVTMMHT